MGVSPVCSFYMLSGIARQLTRLPDAPGVYRFYNQKKEIIYVGKATSLRSRVKSYFRGARTPRPIEQMIHEVTKIDWETTDSALEAAILEGIVIKKEEPKYNILGRDDKSWNYIIITDGEYPEVKTLREHEMKQSQVDRPESVKRFRKVFGPYPGLNTKATLRILRRLFHISTCQPDAKRACLYRQMGECLGVCTGEITSTEYKGQVVRPLSLFLSGKKKRLIRSLEIRMKRAAQAERFEEAARLRNQIGRLQHIHDVGVVNRSFVEDEVRSVSTYGIRIEGYDISNLGKTGMVGSMVVFELGEPNKSAYRKFKIRRVTGQSDVDCLAEVLERRLGHTEWPLPTVFLIDGGLPQVNLAWRVLSARGIDVPIVGIAKGPKRDRNDFILKNEPVAVRAQRAFIRWVDEHRPLLVRVRDEAHRFAIHYQRQTRRL